MAKDKDAEKNEKGSTDTIVPAPIVSEMKDAYLAYAMSVITSRALPDVRDGLKPVHRRILYAMHGMGLSPSARFRKSATVVGEVLGKYHPHGDMAVYDSMVGMAQDFSYRYPLVMGQGNFGSIDGDSAAAHRYTEAKMSRLAEDLLRDIEKDTVNFRPNYDATKNEPIVLPAALPNLLLNGTLGIAVGMATKIPSHNLSETIDAVTHLIKNEDATTEDLLKYIKGPDFPTGGQVFGYKDILHAYSTGRGGVVVRGEAEVTEGKSGQFQIIITSIPYRVNKANLIIAIAKLVTDKKLLGIKDIRDESTKDIRIVIELKSGTNPQRILNYLYKHSQLEEVFHYNIVALVDGVPQTLSLKSLLHQFILHREEVVKRRTEYDLLRAKERAHILEGLKKALDNIDAVIKIIKASKDVPTAKENLMKKFKFSERQTIAILEMKLQKLANLERKSIENELAEKKKVIAELEMLLKSKTKMRSLIASELEEMKKKYADDRRTKVIKGGVKEISDEDLIPDQESVLVYTKGGYVKRTDPKEYRSQKRGGIGVIDLETKDEDFVTTLLTTSTHSDLLFFTNKGKAYQIKMYELPEGRRATKGKSIMNYLQLASDEMVTSILPVLKSKQDSEYLFLITKKGVGKKVSFESFKDVRRSGLIAIKLAPGDELYASRVLGKSDEVMVATAKGQSIRFKASDVREMGRTAGGVRVIKLKSGDYVVGTDIITGEKKDGTFLVISANGLGKQTKLSEYKVQKRGGSGIKTAQVNAKTGQLIIGQIVKNEEELIAISKKGQVIRTEIKTISTSGRQTQGVRIMKLKPNDSIASLTLL